MVSSVTNHGQNPTGRWRHRISISSFTAACHGHGRERWMSLGISDQSAGFGQIPVLDARSGEPPLPPPQPIQDHQSIQLGTALCCETPKINGDGSEMVVSLLDRDCGYRSFLRRSLTARQNLLTFKWALVATYIGRAYRLPRCPIRTGQFELCCLTCL